MDKLIFAIKNANREDFIMATASGLTALSRLGRVYRLDMVSVHRC